MNTEHIPGMTGTVAIRNRDGSARFESASLTRSGELIYGKDTAWDPESVSYAVFMDDSRQFIVCPCCGAHTLRSSEEIRGAMECPACGYCDSDGGDDTDREPGEVEI